MITNSLNKSINAIDALLDGWTFGRLVIDINFIGLQKEDGSLTPVPIRSILEVRNGDQWQRLTPRDLAMVITGGWPAYAGLEARFR